MPVLNTDIADIFNQVADLLEMEDANPFRVRAYRKAARTVDSLPRDIPDAVQSGEDLTKMPGIGKDLAEKIKEIVETGTLSMMEDLTSRTSPGLTKLAKLPGLGPKKVGALHRRLNINTLEELEEAARNKKIRELEGFGEKTEQSILESLEQEQDTEERVKLLDAEQRAHSMVEYIKGDKAVKKITVAGSFRRRAESVGDLDILVTCKKGSRVMDRFVEYEDVKKVVSKGTTRSTIVLSSGLQVDLRVIPDVSYGAALHYFTGSKSHNIAVRKRGVKRGYKINEYGVYKGDKRVAGKTEKEVYTKVGLPYIPPELREDRGEIEAAEENRLPDLVTLKKIRGDLHTHSKYTDGNATIKEMAEAARDMGYEYMAVTDHSKKVTVAKGMDSKQLEKQIRHIDRLNEEIDDFLILKGIEVDILEDGSLDLPDEILKELDLTVCSVHYNQNLSREKQTRRIISAMDNPYFNILAHPTGRLINERKPFEVDMEQIMKAAGERGCFLELNSHPDRLDLNDHHCKMAKDMGIKVAVSTDAHSREDLGFIRFGINQARRGWLEARDVLNTMTWNQMKRQLKRA